MGVKALKYLIILIASLVWFAWFTHIPETTEDQIDSINFGIAPQGYLTKTHLYIHWPAEYTKPNTHTKDPGGKEIVPALTLKIPIEYFPWDYLYYDLHRSIFGSDCGDMTKYENGCETGSKKGNLDYKTRIYGALSEGKHEIKSFHLNLITGAKPYSPKPPEDFKPISLTRIIEATINIMFKKDPSSQENNRIKNFNLELYRNSYVVIVYRDSYFSTPVSENKPEILPYERPPEIECHNDASCTLEFGLKGRRVHIWGMGEALDRPNGKNIHQTDYSLPKPNPNNLPKWHEKLDPTQTLLNSFVLSEDSDEVKNIFITIQPRANTAKIIVN
jgi:hypothetical protein